MKFTVVGKRISFRAWHPANLFSLAMAGVLIVTGCTDSKEPATAAKQIRTLLSQGKSLAISSPKAAQALVDAVSGDFANGDGTALGVRGAVAGTNKMSTVGCLDASADAVVKVINQYAQNIRAVDPGDPDLTQQPAMVVSIDGNKEHVAAGYAYANAAYKGVPRRLQVVLLACPPENPAVTHTGVPTGLACPGPSASPTATSEVNSGEIKTATSGFDMGAGAPCTCADILPLGSAGNINVNYVPDFGPGYACFYNFKLHCGDPQCIGHDEDTCADIGLPGRDPCTGKCVIVLKLPGHHQDLCRGCFAQGARIRLADQSEKTIEQIRPGDSLWNPITHKAVKVKEVSYDLTQETMVEISTGTEKLIVTALHPILTARGPLLADHLIVGDWVTGADGKRQKLTLVRQFKSPPKQPIHNVLLEGDSADPRERMILANGIVTGDMKIQKDLAIESFKKADHKGGIARK